MRIYFYSINFVIYTTQYFLHLRNRALLHCYMMQVLLHICKNACIQ
jgi:hypothetical protein